MRDFVNRYYGQLPMGTQDGWAALDAGYQKKTGLQPYLDFWSTVQSVRVVSIGPRDASSVLARLTYDWKDGHSTTEDRWLSMVARNGGILITDSGVAKANTTVTVTAAPAPANPAPADPGVLLACKALLHQPKTAFNGPNQAVQELIRVYGLDIIYANDLVDQLMVLGTDDPAGWRPSQTCFDLWHQGAIK